MKFEPPILALEYKIKNENEFYLLKVNLSEYLKETESPEKISKLIFKSYSDIFNRKIISERQVIKLKIKNFKAKKFIEDFLIFTYKY